MSPLFLRPVKQSNIAEHKEQINLSFALLTAPKPKAQPFEEPSYEQLKAKPAPAIRQGKTSIDVAIERAKERNREAKAEKYKHSRAFKPRVMARPSRFERVLREVREKEESLLNFDGIKPRPVPKIPDVQVKLNVSSLLRENALYQKQIEEEKRKARRRGCTCSWGSGSRNTFTTCPWSWRSVMACRWLFCWWDSFWFFC